MSKKRWALAVRLAAFCGLGAIEAANGIFFSSALFWGITLLAGIISLAAYIEGRETP